MNEKIMFRIDEVNGEFYRFTAIDCRSIYKEIAGTGGVKSGEIFSEMERITKAVEAAGGKAVFVKGNRLWSWRLW